MKWLNSITETQNYFMAILKEFGTGESEIVQEVTHSSKLKQTIGDRCGCIC